MILFFTRELIGQPCRSSPFRATQPADRWARPAASFRLPVSEGLYKLKQTLGVGERLVPSQLALDILQHLLGQLLLDSFREG